MAVGEDTLKKHAVFGRVRGAALELIGACNLRVDLDVLRLDVEDYAVAEIGCPAGLGLAGSGGVHQVAFSVRGQIELVGERVGNEVRGGGRSAGGCRE